MTGCMDISVLIERTHSHCPARYNLGLRRTHTFMYKSTLTHSLTHSLRSSP